MCWYIFPSKVNSWSSSLKTFIPWKFKLMPTNLVSYSDSIGFFLYRFFSQNKNLCFNFGFLHTLLFLIYWYAALLRVREKIPTNIDLRNMQEQSINIIQIIYMNLISHWTNFDTWVNNLAKYHKDSSLSLVVFWRRQGSCCPPDCCTGAD